ncbi:MAG: sugar phosphate isomerase/epimerase family protein [Thermoguttaceae bacterium]
MNRRNFLTAAAATTACLAATQAVPHVAQQNVALAAPATDVKFRLSSQLGIIPGENDAAKLKKMKEWGCEAVELGGQGRDVSQIKKMVSDAGLVVSAICWGSCNGDLCSDDTSKRQTGIDKLKEQLEAAAELKAVGVIYVPAFNGQTKLTNQEIRKLLLEFMPGVAEFAAKLGTSVILEPLNRGEAFFLRQLADAASICRDVNSDGLGMMGDFYHMAIEETSDHGAFLSAGKYLKHVHLAGGPQDPSRTIPGQNSRLFVDGFRGLKEIGYQHFCSFECGVRGDKDTEIPKAIAFLKSQWNEA